MSNEVYAAKHVRSDPVAMRKEAAILHHLRNEPAIVAFFGLYEGPNQGRVRRKKSQLFWTKPM